MKPLISVLIPTHNGSRYIEKTIRSVLNQSFRELELIIIDDCSTDDTWEVIQKIASTDNRIRAIRNEKNLMVAATANVGIREARGKYIARSDDDDIWIDKDKLKKQISYFDANPGHVLVGTQFTKVDEQGKEIGKVKMPETDRVIRQILLTKNTFGHSTVMYTKEAVEAIGKYDEKLEYGDDYDLMLKLGRIGKIANLPSYSVHYTIRKGLSSRHGKYAQFLLQGLMLRRYIIYYPGRIIALLKWLAYPLLY